ncbi:uncharacterized protein LOC119291416 [Triticum dicoccoides]|uniref:uncharacterized protein LOC119291416 n=1 Tax=Triticum dicoccoides TaxID=85692 RepID=UPI00188F1F9F|nr:uncharacterized protein LOC119291416 [Triticum dicoccoides]
MRGCEVKATPSAFVAFILDLPMLSLYCPTVQHMLLLHGRLFTRLAHGSTTTQVNGFTDAYVCSFSVCGLSAGPRGWIGKACVFFNYWRFSYSYINTRRDMMQQSFKIRMG